MTTWEKCLEMSAKAEDIHIIWYGIPLLGICLIEMFTYVHQKTGIIMFIATNAKLGTG